MRTPDPIAGVFRYQHRAMATLFELMIAGEEESFAGGAAVAAFDEIDRLEQDLSRFLPNSDISRINNLPPDGVTRVSPHTFECLRLSILYHAESGGEFDVTVGALMDCWLARDGSLRTPSSEEIAAATARKGMDRLELDEDTLSVSVRGVAPRIDRGGDREGLRGGQGGRTAQGVGGGFRAGSRGDKLRVCLWRLSIRRRGLACDAWRPVPGGGSSGEGPPQEHGDRGLGGREEESYPRSPNVAPGGRMACCLGHFRIVGQE